MKYSFHIFIIEKDYAIISVRSNWFVKYEKAKSVVSPIIVTNMDQVKNITVEYGSKKALDKFLQLKSNHNYL